MNGWTAFRVGLSRVLRYRQVLVILFAVNLLGALALALLPALDLAAGLGHRPAIRQAADGIDVWLVIETLASWSADETFRQGAVSPGLAPAAGVALLAWLSGAFLNGGVLLTYAEDGRSSNKAGPDPSARISPGPRTAPQAKASVGAPGALPSNGPNARRFHWRRFLWGCWHWFGAFLLLGAVQAVASVVLFVLLVGGAMGTVAAAGGWLTWVVVPLLMLVAILWLALTECTRIVAVVEGTRNVLRAFGGAMRFVLRHLPSVAGLYGPALLLLGLIHALYRWGVMPCLPLGWWPLVLVVQQATIAARLGARLVRLAGGVALVQA